MHHNTVDSCSTDTTGNILDDDEYHDRVVKKRRLKTGQLLKNINYEGQLVFHRKNATMLKGSNVKVRGTKGIPAE